MRSKTYIINYRSRKRKTIHGMKGDLLVRIAERKLEMNAERHDQPGSGTNGGVEVLPTKQNVLDGGRTTLLKIK